MRDRQISQRDLSIGVWRAALCVATVIALWMALATSVRAQSDDAAVPVCNEQTGSIVEVAQVAIDQGSIDFPYHTATDAEVASGACDESFPDVVVDPTSCGHFETYDDAQAAFDEGSVPNPEYLDADGDGIVCEDAFGAGDGEMTEDRYTCDDFANPDEAQMFFDGEATDVQRDILDPDGDGLACEDAYGTDGEYPPARDYTSCGHFESQEDAQAALEDPDTPYRENLDGDDDGVACEEAFATTSGAADESSNDADQGNGSATVLALPSTGSGPSTGGAGWLSSLSVTAAAAMILAAVTCRRGMRGARA